MSKNILILGGSKLQLDLIFEAKKMYFKVYLLDGDEYCIGKKYADEFYNIDFSDKKKVLSFAKKIKPIAVLTIATEKGNITACFISEQLGLKSNTYETSLITTNKIKMKEYLKNNVNIFCRYKVIKNLETLSWDRFPCIVKPIDSSAGRGVSFVEGFDKIEEAVINARKYSSCKEVLIEEYIQGKQYSIETISSNSKHSIVTIVEEFITEPPIIIETQQLVPARINLKKQEKLEKFALRILELYNIKYGACHIEIRENENGKLYLIEIATRMGGWRSELIRFSLGINYCELLINSVLDREILFNKVYEKTSIVKMILNKNHLDEYVFYKENYNEYLISDLEVSEISDSKNLADSNGFYFITIDNKQMINKFVAKH